ncbi:MAG: efflux RND transporter periplasmic adaptor subunit [Planctomycetaceae bacterium]|nr:efflux RND transporter periplasmic adaptor subunit [Planctomycetaceae bacterium]
MKSPLSGIKPAWIRLSVLIVVLLAGGATWGKWWPMLNGWVQTSLASRRPASTEEEGAAHDESDAGHEHEGHEHAHSESASLELSPQAMRNLGLSEDYVRPIKLQTYRRSITVPAVVVVRPGRTQLQVATPMTGVVTHVHAVAGEAVTGGTLLFRIRLTHEDLVQLQSDFVKSLGELDVEEREITRLEKVVESGAVAGKTLLERRYAKEKLEALIGSQREALRLHGLSDRQVDQIAQDRRLLSELEIVAPSPDDHGDDEELRLTENTVVPVGFGETTPPAEPLLVIDQLDVHKGQSVASGTRLCVLSDYSRLYIEASAFEQDSGGINEAVARDWPVSATFADGSVVENLPLTYISNEIDSESRTLRFYVDLPNEMTRDVTNSEGQRFIAWRYRPGQRLQVNVPVEEWADQIVLPVDAVAEEGAEAFVFLQNGKHFDRVPVHVRYRDQKHVIVANDGSVFPGDLVALRSAHQMLLALKNKSGGGVDPHAGHSH